MAETWVLNSTISMPSKQFYINFTSDGQSFTRIVYGSPGFMYSNSVTDAIVYKNSIWTNEAYRTVVFDTAPSGDLLTWLQANGVKQSEPVVETPKSTCFIDGTSYELTGGKILKDASAYSIAGGKTLVSGTAYDISLSKKLSVDIQGTFGYTTVTIDGVSYTSAGVIKAEPDAQVTVTVSGTPVAIKNSAIYYNGSEVATGKKFGGSIMPATYSFTLKSDTTIQCTDYSMGYAIAIITT